MLPLSDEARSRTFPYVTIGIIVLNVLAFVYELSLDDGVVRLIQAAGVIPAEYACRCDLPPSDVGPFWVTMFTSMFLHAGFLHIGGNMLYFWIFGDNVEDALGHAGFLGFYLASGIAAGVAQILVDPNSTQPSLGASGAIAGVMAAYLVLFPATQIRTLLFIGPFFTMRRLPALLIIGIWFLIQFFDGVTSLGQSTAQSDGVAYWAHIGGFVFGLIVAFAFQSFRGPVLARRPARSSLPF